MIRISYQYVMTESKEMYSHTAVARLREGATGAVAGGGVGTRLWMRHDARGGG